MAKLLYFISEDWFFCSHFMERAKVAQANGFDVVVLAREGRHGQRIRDAGLRLVNLDMQRSGTNLWRELGVLRQVWRVYRQERPDVLHHVALKPVLYGSLVASFLRIKSILNAPVGMGYLFTSRDLKARLLQPGVGLLLRALLNPRGSKVVFENPEDLATYVARQSVRVEDAVLIQGAGVDTAEFYPAPWTNRAPVVVMAARMLKDKGVVEFVQAAALLKQRGVRAKFWLVGAPDPANPSSMSRTQLVAWQKQGSIEWLGHREDMPALLRQCDIACLPSYREGLPRFLLEAMATGLAVVSTDAPGCRHAVEQGVSGLLVPVRDAMALADALGRLIQNASERIHMGVQGRDRVLRDFSSPLITQQTLALYEQLADSHRRF
jgi:glycosyltransferase involved in cell wall biosynthesis